MTHLPQSVDAQDMHRRASHGLPLTIAEQRLLVELVTDKPIATRKRCTNCFGVGVAHGYGRINGIPCQGVGTCQRCGGAGYKTTAQSMVEVFER